MRSSSKWPLSFRFYNQSGTVNYLKILRGPFEKFVDWWQCAAVMQREAVTYAKL
jgi:hypothetical protein